MDSSSPAASTIISVLLSIVYDHSKVASLLCATHLTVSYAHCFSSPLALRPVVQQFGDGGEVYRSGNQGGPTPATMARR